MQTAKGDSEINLLLPQVKNSLSSFEKKR